ncbi:hypothetical protein BT69DRAFT_1285437 [Atractiella rhizophila]|nr:hypothetical protein BT69DRAFT_1285437 [Atractiella rhizophila]
MSPPAPTAPEQPDLALQRAAIDDYSLTDGSLLCILRLGFHSYFPSRIQDTLESTTLDRQIIKLLGSLGLHIVHVSCLAQS